MIHETTYTKARQRLAALMSQVTDTREPVLIHRRGHETVAMVPADELAGWLETAHLLRSPRNAQRLLEAYRSSEEGGGEVFTVDEVRERLGLNED